jgi:DnaJ domain
MASVADLLVFLSRIKHLKASAFEGDVNFTLSFEVPQDAISGFGVGGPRDFIESVQSELERLQSIEEKEREYAAQPKGARAADCIGFLYQQRDLLFKDRGAGLARDIGVKLYEATIAHLQELHGRREAADRDAYKRREEAAEQAREKRKAYEKQNAERERANKQSNGPQYSSPFDDIFKDRPDARESFERMYEAFRTSFDEETLRAFYGFTGKSQTNSKNQSTPPPGAKQRWYEILGVPPGADQATIKRAWRHLAKKYHPDKGGSNEMMSKVNAARDEGLRGL